MKRLSLLTLLLVALLSGCATNTDHYYWGTYEAQLYQMSVEPGVTDPDAQINALENDIAMAQEKGKPIPPGLHAHLGMMYAATGNIEKSAENFEIEKTLYPESSVLIDGMMARAAKHAQQGEK